MSSDASPHGVRCVLTHKLSCIGRAPIAAAERQYVQINREALENIIRVEKFHSYVSGRQVEIKMCPKPLISLLGNL
ncbi:hypothetical protein T4E_5396 [Trichinella pseudospiralis]|uniref:Uncharacterized protein n=1 Tax=Trichinella pseudospiralis TaxID=6337 RepID=A0A0V0XQ95_TRIPS|nr:hypothetical protein T4E_5396 [Trichinella pseudospiralis]